MVPLAIFKRGLSIYSICSFAIFNRFIYLIFTYVGSLPVAPLGQPLTSFLVYSCVVFQLCNIQIPSADHSIQPSTTRLAATILRQRVAWTCSRSCCPSSSRLWCLDSSSVCVIVSVVTRPLINFIDTRSLRPLLAVLGRRTDSWFCRRWTNVHCDRVSLERSCDRLPDPRWRKHCPGVLHSTSDSSCTTDMYWDNSAEHLVRHAG